MEIISPSFLPLYDYQSPPISDDEFKRFHTIDRKLYGKLLNVLGREPAESMKVMAFFHWIEGVAKDRYFVANLFDFSSQLLNKIVDEALMCVKCTEDDKFTGYNNYPEIFLIPNILRRNFTLKYFYDNRASAIRGITHSLKTLCFRAFDDIHVVKQPNYYTRSTLFQTPNDVINNPSPYAPIGAGGGGNLIESMIPSVNMIEELGTVNSSRMMSLINPSHFYSGASDIEATRMNPSHVSGVGGSSLEELPTRMVPMNSSLVPSASALNMDEYARVANRLMVPMSSSHVPSVGASNIEEYATRMVPMSPSQVPSVLGPVVGASNIDDQLARGATRMVSMNPNLVPSHVSASNIEELARAAATRMVPMNLVPSHVSASNLEELARAASTRMVPMNPSHVPSVGAAGVGASNIDEYARAAATRMMPMNPSHVQSAGGEMLVRYPYGVPTQMIQYMPPYYNYPRYGSSSGSGVFIPQMLPTPYNYHHDIGGMNMDISEMFKNNLNFLDDEAEIAPEDRTVFLTFSKGYPISEAEVKEFFTRKFGDDVEAVYMQEVAEDEQALYARLVTRSPALLEAIVDGGKAKYNINGKHVWARKYIKKQNPKIMFLGQSSSSVPSTSP
uniref:RRM domain-containing protein n=1 Tax=Solanum tuberosum TaxID=4113 RepID=M1APM9_SOLTU